MNLLEFLCFLDFIFLQPLSCRPSFLPFRPSPCHSAPLVMSSALVIPRALVMSSERSESRHLSIIAVP